MNELQKKRYDTILKDMLRGLAFFDYDGNMWLFDNETSQENFIYNQYEKHITMDEFRKILIGYLII